MAEGAEPERPITCGEVADREPAERLADLARLPIVAQTAAEIHASGKGLGLGPAALEKLLAEALAYLFALTPVERAFVGDQGPRRTTHLEHRRVSVNGIRINRVSPLHVYGTWLSGPRVEQRTVAGDLLLTVLAEHPLQWRLLDQQVCPNPAPARAHDPMRGFAQLHRMFTVRVMRYALSRHPYAAQHVEDAEQDAWMAFYAKCLGPSAVDRWGGVADVASFLGMVIHRRIADFVGDEQKRRERQQQFLLLLQAQAQEPDWDLAEFFREEVLADIHDLESSPALARRILGWYLDRFGQLPSALLGFAFPRQECLGFFKGVPAVARVIAWDYYCELNIKGKPFRNNELARKCNKHPPQVNQSRDTASPIVMPRVKRALRQYILREYVETYHRLPPAVLGVAFTPEECETFFQEVPAEAREVAWTYFVTSNEKQKPYDEKQLAKKYSAPVKKVTQLLNEAHAIIYPRVCERLEIEE